MSMTKEVIKKFIEEDHKDEVVLVTCDNEHKFYHNAYKNAPIIWDWDNDCFIALESNDEVIDQNGHPFSITMVALEEIQFLTAFVNVTAAIDFVNENITDETKKKEIMAVIQKAKPAMMGPRTIRDTDGGKEPYRY